MSDERWAERRRDAAILDCSLKSSNARGCFHAKVDDVVAEVGIGKGTLYRHYASRNELFAATLRANIDALVSHCREVWQAKEATPFAAFSAALLHPGWDPGWIASVTLAIVGVSSAVPRLLVSVTDAAPLMARMLQQSFLSEPQPTAALPGM